MQNNKPTIKAIILLLMLIINTLIFVLHIVDHHGTEGNSNKCEQCLLLAKSFEHNFLPELNSWEAKEIGISLAETKIVSYTNALVSEFYTSHYFTRPPPRF